MKYFGYMPNDFINGEGVCVSLWTAGCPHKCPGCHNSEMWNYKDGYEVPTDIRGQLIKAINANGIMRNLSILGGEPLSNENLAFVSSIVSSIKTAYPNIKIFLWTGFKLKYLKSFRKQNEDLDNILKHIDVLIDGPFIQEKRDITLKLRGSSNQRILYKGEDF